MKIEWKEVNIKGRKIKALLTIKESADRELLKGLYFDWKNVNDRLKNISTRGINLPEAISENAFALFFPACIRVVKLKGMKCSFDCINIKTGSRIQIKASSVASDLTSFGPRSEWDELFFLDFSEGDGSFKVYEIKPDWIYKHKVNKSQTFEEQQKQNRRPRFSITENIINLKKLKPIKICRL
ncbi:MAG TPA: Bsp6I family type II restriction endonuclease [Candidatus Nanoarchaeia archaeon]|nr:Bsp6I family type II restriction endonuclease [Candidatus Nanoarchaeia archaeon]